MVITDDMRSALEVLSDFKKTQPKKKRRNIDSAMRKIMREEPLNKYEKESVNELHEFLRK